MPTDPSFPGNTAQDALHRAEAARYVQLARLPEAMTVTALLASAMGEPIPSPEDRARVQEALAEAGEAAVLELYSYEELCAVNAFLSGPFGQAMLDRAEPLVRYVLQHEAIQALLEESA